MFSKLQFLQKDLSAYLFFLGYKLKKILSFKVSFYSQALFMIVNNCFLLLAWWLLFQNFGNVNGYSFKEIIFIQGYIALWYALVMILFEGLLDFGGRLACSQAFERGDFLLTDLADRQHAGARSLAIEVDGAGAALPQPTSKLGAIEFELVVQHIQQRGVGVGLDRTPLAVDGQLVLGHGGVSSWLKKWPASRRARLAQSAVMPAVLMTLDQYSVSRLTSASSASGGR